MPSINISEQEFSVVASAAQDAFEKGCLDDAKALDKLARKMNAALSNQKVTGPYGAGYTPLKWTDVESVLRGST